MDSDRGSQPEETGPCWAISPEGELCRLEGGHAGGHESALGIWSDGLAAEGEDSAAPPSDRFPGRGEIGELLDAGAPGLLAFATAHVHDRGGVGPGAAIFLAGRQLGRAAALRTEAEAAGAKVIERDPRPDDPDYGCGPRYHRLDTADFAGGLWAPPKREQDVLAEAAWNGMGC